MAKNRFAVIGLGQFGSAIARKLSKKGAEVIAIDSCEDKVEALKEDVAYAVTLDATDKKALQSQSIQDMDAVVVSIGMNFQGLLLCTFILQELKVKRIIARAQERTQKKILEKMGIYEILSPEDEVGNSVAESLLNPSVLRCMELPDEFEIVEIKAPRSITGRSLEDIGLRQKYRLNLVTLLRASNGSHHIVGVPKSDTVIQEEDILMIFGTIKNIDRFIDINE